MVEPASAQQYAFTDKESTEQWLTKHGIEFQVSEFRFKLWPDYDARACVHEGGHEDRQI